MFGSNATEEICARRTAGTASATTTSDDGDGGADAEDEATTTQVRSSLRCCCDNICSNDAIYARGEQRRFSTRYQLRRSDKFLETTYFVVTLGPNYLGYSKN